jgi:hypothetical protein
MEEKTSLLREHDFSDSALNFEVNRRWRFSVGVIRIGVSVMLQTVRTDGADATGSMSDNPDIPWQADIGLPDASLDIRHEIGFSVAS